ncbi:MAG: hypothetical protein V4527_13775 [Pseudomonadota bacterium]
MAEETEQYTGAGASGAGVDPAALALADKSQISVQSRRAILADVPAARWNDHQA